MAKKDEKPTGEQTIQAILTKFDSWKNAERALKDTKKEGLDDLKEAKASLDESISKARSGGDVDAAINLSIVLQKTETLESIKSRVKEDVAEAKDAAKAAKTEFEEVIAAARQVEMF